MKIITGLTLAALSGIATASPFYVDVNTNYAPGIDKACPTCTSVKNELTYAYQSYSVTLDSDGSGGLSAGDVITTSGGLAVGGLADNVVTGFLPSGFGGVNADNGYGTDWLLTFDFTGLTGQITEYTPGTSLEIAYGPGGTFHLYFTTDGGTLYNFMNIDVLGAATGSGGTLLAGLADFSNVGVLTDADPTNDWMVNLLHSAHANCAGDTGFYDIWKNCDGSGIGLIDIGFLADFNTNLASVSITDNGPAGATLSGNHDGSASFNVPEPGSLLLIGGSLLLLGAGRAKRS